LGRDRGKGDVREGGNKKGEGDRNKKERREVCIKHSRRHN